MVIFEGILVDCCRFGGMARDMGENVKPLTRLGAENSPEKMKTIPLWFVILEYYDLKS